MRVGAVRSSREKEAEGDVFALYNSLTGRCNQVGVRLCSEGTRDRRGNYLQLPQGRVRLDIKRIFFHVKCCQALEGAVQGGDGVPVPADVQGRTGHGTRCSGLAENQSQLGLRWSGESFPTWMML